MFPWFIFEVILSFLDQRTLIQLRHVNQEFNHLALTILLKRHALQKDISKGYISFLQKNGGFIQGLIVHDTLRLLKLGHSGISFARVFPHLFAITLHNPLPSRNEKDRDMSALFLGEFQKLKWLKHLSICSENDLVTLTILAPLIRRLDTLYINFEPHCVGAHDLDLNGLRRLAMPLSGYSRISEEYLRSLTTIKEFISTGPYFEVDYSTPENDIWCDKFMVIEASMTFQFRLRQRRPNFRTFIMTQNPDPLGRLIWNAEHCLESGKLKDISYFVDCIDHVTILAFDEFKSDNLKCLDFIKKVTSIELDCCGTNFVIPHRNIIYSEKLTLPRLWDCFPKYFQWASQCFPNLKHFLINNQVPLNLLPLERNSFPNLTHFYSEATQFNEFWSELVLAAPTLSFIYSDLEFSNISEIESLKPNLQYNAYRPILPAREALYDICRSFW